MGRLPVPSDFPPNLTLTIVPRESVQNHLVALITDLYAYPAPTNDSPTNALILLHGLGDTHATFATLAQQMNLPETVCISLEGPQNLLDLGGKHWGDDIIFDSSSGGIDADGGFKGTTTILRSIIDDVLVEKAEFKRREILLFGFGQGGMAALNLAGVSVSSSMDRLTLT